MGLTAGRNGTKTRMPQRGAPTSNPNYMHPVCNPYGISFLRADCHLKRMVALESRVDRGIQHDRCVFPFKVWDDGGPADQVIFIPTGWLESFENSVERLTKYKKESLNRQSLHFIHCKRCLKGRLIYHRDVVADANSIHAWNPYYTILGRREKPQEDRHRAKWGDHWFE